MMGSLAGRHLLPSANEEGRASGDEDRIDSPRIVTMPRPYLDWDYAGILFLVKVKTLTFLTADVPFWSVTKCIKSWGLIVPWSLDHISHKRAKYVPMQVRPSEGRVAADFTWHEVLRTFVSLDVTR